MKNIKSNYKTIFKDKADKIIRDIDTNKAKNMKELDIKIKQIDELTKKKKDLLDRGSEEEYIKAGEELARAELSKEFLENKLMNTEKAAGISRENLALIKAEKDKELKRLTVAMIQEVNKELAMLKDWLKEVKEEKDSINKIYEMLYQKYVQRYWKTTPENIKNSIANEIGPDYSLNYIDQTYSSIERVEKWINQPMIRDYIK